MTDAQETAANPLPHFPVEIAAPDIAPWLAGNTGIEGVTSIESAVPGPHVVLLALTHGNEIAGAIVLDRLLRAGLRPRRGRLSVVFANLDAFSRFDPAQPTASRFVDEDLNRVWDTAVLEGAGQSSELSRARALRPLVDTADVLVDLHSMLWPSEPLILCGQTSQGRALGLAIGVPPLVVADAGHVGGRRLIDYPRFAGNGPAAVLVEAGQHWQRTTVETSLAAVAAALRHVGLVEDDCADLPPPVAPAACRFAQVTHAVTAGTASFAFVRAFRGGEVIPRRNTVIAVDGEVEIRTPHDNCLLVMPSLRPSRGHTAVRLARVETGS